MMGFKGSNGKVYTSTMTTSLFRTLINGVGQQLTRMYVNFHWLQFDGYVTANTSLLKLKFSIMRVSIFDYLKTFSVDLTSLSRCSVRNII